MIAQIDIKTQYGKTGLIGVNAHEELDEDCVTCFAHSVQDALDWVDKQPGYSGATVGYLGDGRFVVTTPWTPRNTTFDLLITDEGHDGQVKRCDQQRIWIGIYPRNTIYENPGFRGA